MSNLDQEQQAEDQEPSKLSKWKTLKNVLSFTKKLETEEERQRKWHERRLRLAQRSHGGLKEDSVDSMLTGQRPPRKKPSVFQYAKESLTSHKKPTEDGKGDIVDSSGAIIDAMLDRNETPREFGVGLAGEVLHTEYSNQVITTRVRQQMDEMEDYRPYFSYWITTVQIIVMIITMCWYSIAPIDVELALKSDFVFTESLSYQQVAFYQPNNFWIGPRP